MTERKATQAMKSRSKSRRFRGHAVIAYAEGPLIWGTFRHDAADAWKAYERHNPPVDGHPSAARLVRVEMTIRPLP